jgi:dihydrofolate reductase
MAVIMGAVVSLDGYIAYPDDMPGALFDWYGNGDVEWYGTDPDRPFHTTQGSADYTRGQWGRVGATVIGRRLFDITDGWNGVPPAGDHVVVVTHRPVTGWDHPDAPFTFVGSVAEGIAAAKDISGDKDVSVMAGDIGGQALAAGLVDEVALDVVPLIMGEGVPFFGHATLGTTMLENPDDVVQGDRVLHLRYRVRRDPGAATG